MGWVNTGCSAKFKINYTYGVSTGESTMHELRHVILKHYWLFIWNSTFVGPLKLSVAKAGSPGWERNMRSAFGCGVCSLTMKQGVVSIGIREHLRGSKLTGKAERLFIVRRHRGTHYAQSYSK